MHQEVLVRDIPGIGTRQAKHQQVTNRQLRNRLLPGQHILGRAQLAYQGDVLTAYLRGICAPHNRERMVMVLRCRRAEMMSAASTNGKKLAVAAF